MKKLIIALLVIGLLPVIAYAGPPGTEVASWAWDEDNNIWVFQSSPEDVNLQALGRLFSRYPEFDKCNKDFVINVTVIASVAQWIEWSITGKEWKWYVRKPGNYGGDCITGTIKSNQDVLIDYEGFEPLLYQGDKPSPVDTIPIWYAVGDFVTPPPKGDPEWVWCRDLNNDDDLLEDCQDLHEGIQFKLWNYIHVVECNSACEYMDEATITLKLQCQKDWIDRDTGYFKP